MWDAAGDMSTKAIGAIELLWLDTIQKISTEAPIIIDIKDQLALLHPTLPYVVGVASIFALLAITSFMWFAVRLPLARRTKVATETPESVSPPPSPTVKRATPKKTPKKQAAGEVDAPPATPKSTCSRRATPKATSETEEDSLPVDTPLSPPPTPKARAATPKSARKTPKTAKEAEPLEEREAEVEGVVTRSRARAAEAVEPQPVHQDWSKSTVADMKAELKSRGVKGATGLKKAELIELLQGLE
jgi:cytoskeletal protein RodZ